MKIRTVLLTFGAISALSTGAFAADRNPHDQGHPSSREQMSASCSVLESQYDNLISGKTNQATDKAAGLHAQGVSACESNNTDIGVQKLQQAVRDLGEKPAA